MNCLGAAEASILNVLPFCTRPTGQAYRQLLADDCSDCTPFIVADSGVADFKFINSGISKQRGDFNFFLTAEDDTRCLFAVSERRINDPWPDGGMRSSPALSTHNLMVSSVNKRFCRGKCLTVLNLVFLFVLPK